MRLSCCGVEGHASVAARVDTYGSVLKATVKDRGIAARAVS